MRPPSPQRITTGPAYMMSSRSYLDEPQIQSDPRHLSDPRNLSDQREFSAWGYLREQRALRQAALREERSRRMALLARDAF